MASFAKLNVLLTADATQFQSTLSRAGRTLTAFGGVLVSMAKKSAIFVGSIVGIGQVGFGLLIKQSFRTIDALGMLSDRLGVTSKQLSGLQFAAKQTGVGAEVLNRALTTMVKRLGEVQIGKGDKFSETLRRIGLSAKELGKLKPDEAIRRLVDAIRGLPTQAQRIAITAEVFGTPEFVNLVNLGSKALKAMTEQATFLGISIGKIGIDKIRSANVAFGELGTAIRGAAEKAAINLAPSLQKLAENLTPIVKVIGDMVKSRLPVLVDFLAEKIPNAFRMLLELMKRIKIAVLELTIIILEQIENILAKIAELSDVQITLDPTRIPGGFGRGLAIIREALGKEPFQPIVLGKVPILPKGVELAKGAVAELRETVRKLNEELVKAKGPDSFAQRMLDAFKRAVEAAKKLRQRIADAVAEAVEPTIALPALAKPPKPPKPQKPKPPPIPEILDLVSIDDKIQRAAFEEVDIAKQQLTVQQQILIKLATFPFLRFAGP